VPLLFTATHAVAARGAAQRLDPYPRDRFDRPAVGFACQVTDVCAFATLAKASTTMHATAKAPKVIVATLRDLNPLNQDMH
jgi:hypothetical protein